MSALVRTVDLAIGYKTRSSRTVILENLNLSAHTGELVCLLGTNGTGKSTLLRSLSKIQPSLSGRVEIQGVDVQQLSPIELARRVGVVLTERPAVGALTARRMVELGRYPYWDWSGRMRRIDHDVVEWAIEAVGGAPLASRDTMSLSDGERQRFMIARALAQEPAILLLDEPTAFLDVPARVELMALLRRLAREEELAIIVSTHDLDLALRMADTLWLVSPGNRLDAGTPEDLILSGQLAGAFQAHAIRFQPEERAFRLVMDARKPAVVHGDGLNAVLAAAVLEREGYEIVASGGSEVVVVTVASEGAWKLLSGGVHHAGNTFGSLAQFVRAIAAPKSSELKS